MPERLAKKLDRVSARLGASKRDLLAALVDQHLDVDGDDLVLRLSNDQTWATEQAQEILTVDEAAALLRVPVADVTELIESGDLPARRVGQQWRLTRAGVLAWLGGGDGPAGVRAKMNEAPR